MRSRRRTPGSPLKGKWPQARGKRTRADHEAGKPVESAAPHAHPNPLRPSPRIRRQHHPPARPRRRAHHLRRRPCANSHPQGRGHRQALGRRRQNPLRPGKPRILRERNRRRATRARPAVPATRRDAARPRGHHNRRHTLHRGNALDRLPARRGRRRGLGPPRGRTGLIRLHRLERNGTQRGSKAAARNGPERRRRRRTAGGGAFRCGMAHRPVPGP